MLPANTPFVILTGRADSAAIKATMALDVSGVAIAPLSFEKLTKVISNAVSRTWTLKQKEDYAAVQLVSSTKAAPPPGTGANKSPKARTILHKDTASSSSGTYSGVSSGSTAGKRPVASQEIELKKVHLSNLVHVAPGDVVARDIKDKDGKMLVSVGTVLSTNIIDRLKEHAGGHPDSYHLWVGEFDN